MNNKTWLQDFSRTKTIAAFLILSLLVLLSIFYLIRRSNQAYNLSLQLVEHSNKVLLENEKTLHYVYQVSTTTRGYLLEGDSSLLTYHDQLQAPLEHCISNLRNLTTDNPIQQSKINEAHNVIISYLQFSKGLIEKRKREGFEAADRLFVTHEGKRLLDRINLIGEQIENEERRLLTIRKTNNNRRQTVNGQLLLTLESLIVLLLIIGGGATYYSVAKRNKAEVKLKRSNVLINCLINNSANPISIRDLSGNYLMVNTSFASYLGISKEQIENKHYSLFFAADTCCRIKEMEDELIKSKAEQQGEFQYVTNDKYYWYKASIFPLLDQNSKIFAIGSVLTDITERKKSEEDLRANNLRLQFLLDRMQQLLDTSLDVICLIDKEGRFVQISSTCERLLGYTCEELTGQKFINFVHPDDVEKTKKVEQSILLGTRYNDFENRYCSKEGLYVPIIWVAMWCEEEQLMYCIAKNATRKQQTLEQLKESEQSLARAQQIANLGGWRVDFQKGTVSGSEQFYKIIGKAKEDRAMLLEEFIEIPHPADKTGLKEAFEKAVVTNRLWEVEFRIVREDSSLIYVSAHAEVLVDKNMRPLLLEGTIQDITQRKKLEHEREMVIEELIKSNADLKQFSFITSHNFRAPLSNIIGILSLLDYNKIEGENKDLLEMIKTASLQLNKTIADLTNILLIKNEVKGSKIPVLFKEIYERVERVYCNELIKVNGVVETDFQVEGIEFNAVYLESILINLYANALNYRSPNRNLRIVISTEINEDASTVLKFSDNGLGIDLVRNGGKIFGLYQRFHERSVGEGLGLFMIKTQIMSLGGKIDVESEVDKGTTFIITFKCNQLMSVGKMGTLDRIREIA